MSRELHAPFETSAETVPSSVARLRRFAVQACRTGAPGVDGDVVALLVSELVTNALLHGSGEVRLRVLPVDGGVRVEVHDASRTLPSLRHPRPDEEGGRGIALVDTLATTWGADACDDGKTVWFVLH